MDDAPEGRAEPDAILRAVCTAIPAMRMLPALAATASLATLAGGIDATIRDGTGAPLADAVVWAVPRPGPAPRVPRTAEIEQKDRQFRPRVTVVEVGAAVSFPNRDPYRHHVYSFSPAKRFEIKLYVGTPADHVVFDKPGEVVLGCNIHDDMLGYVYVVDTPWHAKSDDRGRARLEGLPAGEYEVRAWHHQQAAALAPQGIRVADDANVTLAFGFALRPMPPRPVPR